MMPASNRGAGGTIGFPDVCNTPVGPATAPIPYPNLGFNAMAVPFSPNVYVTMANALNAGSIIPLTTGDEAGVAHPTIKGPAMLTGNPLIYVNMLPAVHLCCPSTGNNMNAGLGAVLVPSVTNVFFTYRRGAPEDARPLDAAALAELSLGARDRVSARMLAERIGYLDLPPFDASLPTRAAREIARLGRAGMRALVIDLRDNPGGHADAFARLAEDFLPAGSGIGRRTDADGDEIVLRSRYHGDVETPLLLLVNRWTASAAELFAGCLQWHRRALVMGEATYGKGRARKVAAGPSGHVEVDAAVFALPGGEPVERVGIRPDVEVAAEPGSTIAVDAALARAMAILGERMTGETR